MESGDEVGPSFFVLNAAVQVVAARVAARLGARTSMTDWRDGSRVAGVGSIAHLFRCRLTNLIAVVVVGDHSCRIWEREDERLVATLTVTWEFPRLNFLSRRLLASVIGPVCGGKL